MNDFEKEYSVIRKLVSEMNPEELLSYGEIYGFLREELNNKMIDIIEEWDKAPEIIKEEDEDNYDLKLYSINSAKLGNINYGWKSPRNENDNYFGWIKLNI